MAQELTRKLAKELMKVGGEARGVVFKTDAEFVLKEKGQEGLKKVKEELQKAGFPIDYEKIHTMDFYPIGLRTLSLLAIKKALRFSDKDMERMGAQAPKISLVIKLFMRFFLSLERTVEQAPEMWKKHYTVGELSAESDEEKRYAIVRVRNLDVHPVLCSYLAGYFSTVVQMVVKKEVRTEETKCSFRGDEYHEYLLKW